jgi:valyl-tRNA synthetase
MSKSKKNTIDPENIIQIMVLMQQDYLFYQIVHLKKMFNGQKKELFLLLNLFKNYGI